MDYVAIVTLELNGNTYERGEVIAPADVPTTKLRRFIDKGMIDVVGENLGITGPTGPSGASVVGPTGPAGPAADAIIYHYHSGLTVANNTHTRLPHTGVGDYDPLHWNNPAGEYFNIGIAGFYRVVSTVVFTKTATDESENNTSGQRAVTIKVNSNNNISNGTQIGFEMRNAMPSVDPSIPTDGFTIIRTETEYEFDLNDKIQVWAWQNSGKSLYLYGGWPSCKMEITRSR